jgi:SAM-dependent methyltransferase
MSNRSSWTDMRRVIQESVGLIGFWMTLRYLIIYWLSYKPSGDRSFDRHFNTDTAGLVPSDDLDIDDDATRHQSNLYLGSPARVTRHLIRSLGINCADYSFVDYGSGKGRAVLVAAEFPFRRVVGVEISEQLHTAAESNLQRYTGTFACPDVELWCGNALDYPLPDGDLVLHMYHPVGPDILRRLLEVIEASARAKPRRILVLYLFSISVSKAVFQDFPAYKILRDELCVNNLYRWTLYECRPNSD